MDGPGHIPCSVVGSSDLAPCPLPPSLVPVRHVPVHGIVTNPGKREGETFPLSFFVVRENPIHRVMVTWDLPISQVIHLPGPYCTG